MPTSVTADPCTRQVLRRLEWQTRRLRGMGLLAGSHASPFRGRGSDFDQVVRYLYGDDFRDIDWNVSARLGELHRKVHVEDRELTVQVLFADTPALQFGSGRRSKRDVLLEITGLIMLLAVGSAERTALRHLCADACIDYAPARRRERVLAQLARLAAAPVPDPGRPADPVPALPTGLATGSVVLWLGEVPAGQPSTAWRQAARRHRLVGIRVDDAWDRQPPALSGLDAYDPVAGRIVRHRDTTAARKAHAEWREAREARWRDWWPHAQDRLQLDADGDPLRALLDFLRKGAQRTGTPEGR